MNRRHYRQSPASPLKKAVSTIIGLALLVLGLMFSAVLLAVLVVVGLAVWAYLWWKTRELRRILRERPAPAANDNGNGNGNVFEGEARVVEIHEQIEHIDTSGPPRQD
jgi:hypothetical protein